MAGGVAERRVPGVAAPSAGAAPFEVPGIDRVDVRILWGFLVAGLVTRLLGHVNDGLWFDEIWTLVDFIRLPLGQLLVTYGSDNNHPLYSVLAWFSIHGLGESAFSLRLPALLFGAGSLGMLYWMARGVTSRFEAALATTLLLLSYHHVWFSQNARGYTILLFSTLGATHFFLENLKPGAGWKGVFLQGLMLAMGTFAHASAVFVAVAQLFAYGLWLFQIRGERGQRQRWMPFYGLIAGGLLSVLMHAGILLEMIAYFAHNDAGSAPAPEGANNEWQSPWWTIKATVESLGIGLWPGMIALVGGLAVIGLGGLSYLRRTPVATLAFVLPIMGAVLNVAMGRSLRPRFLFFEAGFFLLFIVRGMVLTTDFAAHFAGSAHVEAARTWLRRAGAVAAIGVFVVILPRAYALPKQDYEGAMAYANSLKAPDTAVLTLGLAVMPYARYYGADFTPVENLADFEAAVRGKRRVYAINTISVYLDGFRPELGALLKERGTEVKRFVGSMGDGDVIVYEIRPPGGSKGEQP